MLGSLARADEQFDARTDFLGLHFLDIDHDPSQRGPTVTHTISVPRGQLRGLQRDGGKWLVTYRDERGTVRTHEADAYLEQHNGGPIALHESLQVARMVWWDGHQIASARFQAIPALARQGYLRRPSDETALRHDGSLLGITDRLSFSDRLSSGGRDEFGAVAKPAVPALRAPDVGRDRACGSMSRAHPS